LLFQEIREPEIRGIDDLIGVNVAQPREATPEEEAG
jgi:hypothetical protein